MGTAVEPSAGLTVSAPDGADFEYDEVKTAGGTQSLGNVPLLVWKDADKARAYYGDEGILAIMDGTSLRVSFQSIARRHKAAKKTDDEIAKAQIDFRPGKRVVGESTPQSRAKRAAGDVASKLSNPELLTTLLEKIKNGEISEADLASLAS